VRRFALVLLSLGAAVGAQAANVAVVVADPTNSGTTRVQVVLSDPAVAAKAAASPMDTFRAEVTGTAVVTKATALSATGGVVRTSLVFDQSKSFKRHWTAAFAHAETFVGALETGGGHVVEVGTFGQTYRSHGDGNTPAEVRALLTTAKDQGATHRRTRLHALLKDAVDGVGSGLPLDQGGLRQVVVFTDLDEEGLFTVDQLIEEARGQGVRVNIVAYGAEKVSADRSDETMKLAVSTGGEFIAVEDAAAANEALKSFATADKRAWWLELSFCDVPADRGLEFQDELRAETWEGTTRLGRSAPFPFRQRADADSTDSCEPEPPPEPEVEVALEPEPAPAPAGLPPWIWGLLCIPLGLLGLLALPFLLALRGRGSATSAVVEPAPPAPAPAPDIDREGDRAPNVFEPVDASVVDRLPEVRLVKVSGPPGIAASVLVDRGEISVGANPGHGLVLSTDTVSGDHAKLELFKNGTLRVTDTQSTNGTWVDGERIPSGGSRVVHHGNTVGFGSHVLYKVVHPDRAEKPAAPAPAAKPHRKTTFRPVKGKGKP
jgi:hypothetical protein